MKFCMVTSFFGAHSFGGDSVYVERLSAALTRRGHEVHVTFSPGAFEYLRKGTALRSYTPPEGVVLHPLSEGPFGPLNLIWCHQTGHSVLYYQELKELFHHQKFDVIHFHNISLLGTGKLLQLARRQPDVTTLLTAHDYWWICPQSLLWNGRGVCDSARCIGCTLRRCVPPQLWRRNSWFNRALADVHALMFSSRSASRIYLSRGLRHERIEILPGLLPGGWSRTCHENKKTEKGVVGEKPFLIAAGRLVREKGFHTLIPLMRHLPGLDLLLAGDGPQKKELELLSKGVDNVRFLGLIPHGKIRLLFQRARAVVVPSLFPETFCLVAAEAVALSTPVIARRCGAIPELLDTAAKGEMYDTEDELLELFKKIEKAEYETAGRQIPSLHLPEVWFEQEHLNRYLAIISEIRGQPGNSC